MPIQNYGEAWRVQQSNFGRTSPRAIPVDFSAQIGVYILFDELRLVYIGRAGNPEEGTILSRVQSHHDTGDKGSWDTFAWFGFRPVGIDGTLRPLRESTIWYDDEIRDMEALLVYVLKPPHNLRSGDYRHLPKYYQVPREPQDAVGASLAL
jgi:hypothetical protein